MPVIFPDISVQAQTNKALELGNNVAGGSLQGAKCRLFVNDFVPSPLTVLGDFVEATFTGYVAGGLTVSWSNMIEEGLDGSASVAATSTLEWAGPGDATDQLIYGLYLVDISGTLLIAAVRFDQPVSIVEATEILTLLPTYRVP